MIKSEDKKTGNPLSIIPKYTINSMLDWQVNSKLSANADPQRSGPDPVWRHGQQHDLTAEEQSPAGGYAAG
jgi:outer membrane receptor for ferrienterochelin and colicin